VEQIKSKSEGAKLAGGNRKSTKQKSGILLGVWGLGPQEKIGVQKL